MLKEMSIASTGAPVEELSKINLMQVRNEHQLDHLILAILAKRSAYNCIKGMT